MPVKDLLTRVLPREHGSNGFFRQQLRTTQKLSFISEHQNKYTKPYVNITKFFIPMRPLLSLRSVNLLSCSAEIVFHCNFIRKYSSLEKTNFRFKKSSHSITLLNMQSSFINIHPFTVAMRKIFKNFKILSVSFKLFINKYYSGCFNLLEIHITSL